MSTNFSTYDPTNEQRTAFDWIMFLTIHGLLITGIAVIAFWVYSAGLATWVSISAVIAGLVCMYLFAKLVPAETVMKVVLYVIAAGNAGYLAYNGAHEMGIDLFNNAQSAKYGAAAKEAGQARRKGAAKTIMDQASKDTTLEKAFNASTSTIAGFLAFLELMTALIVFAIASRRVSRVKREYDIANGTIPPPPIAEKGPAGFASPAPVTAQSPRQQTGFAPPPGRRVRSRPYAPISEPPSPPNSPANRT